MNPDGQRQGTLDRSAHLEFRHSVEGLFLRELKGELSPELVARLREAGLDLSRLEPAYPADRFAQFLRLTAAELYGELSEAEAIRLLGRRMLRGYGETAIGRAIFGVMRVLGLERAINRITESFRSGDNYTMATLAWKGRHEVWITFNDAHDLPTYNQGILDQLLIFLAAPQPSVELVSCDDGREAVYRLTWRG